MRGQARQARDYQSPEAAVVRILERFACASVDLFETMPTAQGMVIAIGLSIFLGTISESSTVTLASIVRWMSLIIIMSMGALTLWLLRKDRRSSRNMIGLGVLLIMASNFTSVFQFRPEVHSIIYDISSVTLMIALFIAGGQATYSEHPEWHPRKINKKVERRQ